MPKQQNQKVKENSQETKASREPSEIMKTWPDWKKEISREIQREYGESKKNSDYNYFG